MSIRFRHVILDRDGVLNVEPTSGRYVRDWADWRWIPGALEALARLTTAGIRISVATNQSCVGRGLLTRERLDAIHARALDAVARAGGKIDWFFVCPHLPADNCACRKPMPGLLQMAVASAGIPAQETLAVGDDVRDLEAAAAAGIAAALVRTGKGASAEARAIRAGVPAFDDLGDLTDAILADAIVRAHQAVA